MTDIVERLIYTAGSMADYVERLTPGANVITDGVEALAVRRIKHGWLCFSADLRSRCGVLT